jgi:DNA-binding NarL/FixJ family response regulator
VIRVVIADDHPVVRTGLRSLLEPEPDIEVVGEAADGSEAVSLAGRLEPDVVLMDLRMPGVDGVTATRRIKERHDDVHVLILTTYDTDADILRAIEAGATGYLVKDATRDELLDAVRLAAGGDAILAPTVARRVMGRLRAPAAETLTAREIEVLELVARGLTNREIGERLFVGEATVKTHLLHVYAKLGVDDRTAAVTTALERGIMRLED